MKEQFTTKPNALKESFQEQIIIPKHEPETLARCFLTDIQAFFQTEEWQKEYQEWLQQRAKIKAEKDNTA